MSHPSQRVGGSYDFLKAESAQLKSAQLSFALTELKLFSVFPECGVFSFLACSSLSPPVRTTISSYNLSSRDLNLHTNANSSANVQLKRQNTNEEKKKKNQHRHPHPTFQSPTLVQTHPRCSSNSLCIFPKHTRLTNRSTTHSSSTTCQAHGQT